MFPDKFFEYLQEHTLVEIKGGNRRSGFLKIWMVRVEDRVFARTWNRSPKSWFIDFQTFGISQIKCGPIVLDVYGRKLEKTDPMNKLIDQAYLKKYVQPENLIYAKGISQPDYADYTMEFFYDQI